MELEQRTDRIKRLIAEVEREKATPQLPMDDLLTAYKINSRSMVKSSGIMETIKYLQHRNRSANYILDYVIRGLNGRDIDSLMHPHQEPPSINIEGDNNTLTINIIPSAPQPITPPVDEDPHRFTTGDFVKLISKLEKHELWAALTELENDYLKQKSKGPINAKLVALIGLLWRKNIRQNTFDPGAVPYDAAASFCNRDSSFIQRSPSDLQIGAALHILEGVGFLKLFRRAVRGSNGNKGTCAAYQLVNECHWN